MSDHSIVVIWVIKTFLYSSSVYSCHLFLISSASVTYEESWGPKNWCFWTVVLEKTLESPLDCKEIQPVMNFYCWSLAWRILSIILLACEMSAIVQYFEYSFWHCLSLGLEWKQTFSSPVATGEFSKFAGIFSAVLSQHHLLGFEITQLEFHHLH